MKLLIKILLLLFTLSSQAQNFEEDIKCATELYKKNSYVYEAQHFYYTFKDNELIETQRLSVIKDNNYYHSNSYGIETIVNKKFRTIINHNSKMVFVYDIEDNTKTDTKNSDLEEVKEAFNNFVLVLSELKDGDASQSVNHTVKYEGTVDGMKKYNLKLDKGQYSNIEIFISKKTGEIVQTIYTSREDIEISPMRYDKVKLVVLNSKFKSKGRIVKKNFETDNIFDIRENNQVVLKNRYKDYTLISRIR